MRASDRHSGSWFKPNSVFGWTAVAFTVLSVALLFWAVAVPYGQPFRSITPAGAAGALALATAMIAIAIGDRNLTTLLLAFVFGFVFFLWVAGSM